MPAHPRAVKPLPEWAVKGLAYKKDPPPEAVLAPISLRNRYYTARTNLLLVREFGVTNIIESDLYLPEGKKGPFPVLMVLPVSAGSSSCAF